ncbi:MAG TPA: YraN family protein [Syntrophomonadaceae bacterium]|nr:YraN family protein [Syntrophomonadaceae bacterium]
MKQETGKFGEDLAAAFLRKKGYRIRERNYRTPYGEIDIICQNHQSLIFIEVKTRKTETYGAPYEAVNKKKIDHLKKAASLYLQSLDRPFADIRFDVVSILLQEKGNRIEHIVAAF